MNDEQFQRRVDFIVAQQGTFSADIAKLEANLALLARESRENFAKIADVILSLANHNEGQDERIAAHDRQIADLIESGRQTDQRFKETDERINALIALAERFFSGNGKQEQ